MGIRGPIPKDPALRKRRNKPPQTDKLPTAAEAKKNKVPAMPPRPGKRKWSKSVQEWWASIWQSPMSKKWLDSDIKGVLHHLLTLQQFAHEAETPATLLPLLTAIRQHEARLGLSPTDRQRLRWEVPAEGEEAKRPENPGQRPWEADDEAPVGTKDEPRDPRDALSVTDGGMARKKKA